MKQKLKRYKSLIFYYETNWKMFYLFCNNNCKTILYDLKTFKFHKLELTLVSWRTKVKIQRNYFFLWTMYLHFNVKIKTVLVWIKHCAVIFNQFSSSQNRSSNRICVCSSYGFINDYRFGSQVFYLQSNHQHFDICLN